MEKLNLDDFLREAASLNASDLYLAAGAVPCIAVEGRYQASQLTNGERLTPEFTARMAKNCMSARQWADFENTLEANLAYTAEDIGRFRINCFWQRGSVAMVCRRVVWDIPTLRKLGLPPVMRRIALEDRGIVLVTGSTGSGKSTSLASMINYRNHIRSGHIVTIEDPVEFVYRHRKSVVTQREVGIDTLSFHEALKNSLRQAPQVICIGEMRDAETVQFAMHAAETGHLVFATLHSTNSTLAIERILHFYPGEMKAQVAAQLALNLKAIICQRLIPRPGGGRAAAIEILVNTPRIADLINKYDLGQIRMALAAENQDGMQSFDKSIYRLVKQGTVTVNDAMQAAESANDLALKLRGIGIEPGSSWEDIRDPWLAISSDYDAPEDSPLHGRDARDIGGYTNEGRPSMSQVKRIPSALSGTRGGGGGAPQAAPQRPQTGHAGGNVPPSGGAAGTGSGVPRPPMPPGAPGMAGPPRPAGPPGAPGAPPQRYPAPPQPGVPQPGAPLQAPPRPPQQGAPPPPRPTAQPPGMPPRRDPNSGQG